jgi:8-oxo-dGTP pyrophosphatase MutT (NUDIX family)
MKQPGRTQGVVVNVIRQIDGTKEFLFLKRAGGQYQGEWWPVAGTCVDGEQPVDTALRELREETQLVPREMYSLGLEIGHLDGASKLAGYVAFVSPDCNVTLNYEHVECKWLPIKEVYDVVRSAVHPVIDHINSTFVENAPDLSTLVWRNPSQGDHVGLHCARRIESPV